MMGNLRLLSAKICSRQVRSNEFQYNPPAVPKPPPTTITSGSSTFTRNAVLTPSASPAEVNISNASLSPFDAARNTSSQLSADSVFLICAKRLAIAGPEATSSNTGRNFGQLLLNGTAAPIYRAAAGHIPIAVHKLCHAGSDTSHFDTFPTRPVVQLLDEIQRIFQDRLTTSLRLCGNNCPVQYFAGRPQDHSGCDLGAPNLQSDRSELLLSVLSRVEFDHDGDDALA